MQPYSLIKGDDDRQRCAWCEEHPLYISYHDNEWGVPVFKDRAHFEFIVLESAQAGLSWLTVLRKRKAYRKAYANFDIDKIASWGVNEIETLMNNSGIIRNRKKIEASISNARAFIEISTRHGSFANWLLEFFDGEILINNWKLSCRFDYTHRVFHFGKELEGLCTKICTFITISSAKSVI